MELSSINPGTIILVVVTLSLAPFVAVMVTSFTKLVIVLSLLRNALGLQQTPPNVVINGLAIILSIYVMYPVLISTYDKGATRFTELTQEGKEATFEELIEVFQSSKQPLQDFLIKHSSETERAFFLKSLKRLLPPEKKDSVTASDFIVIVPAFTVSELTAAFQIGFLIFLPFLVIDLLVANILLALGMMMLSPTMVSLPFKLLLFVFISGWTQLIHGLVLTYT